MLSLFCHCQGCPHNPRPLRAGRDLGRKELGELHHLDAESLEVTREEGRKKQKAGRYGEPHHAHSKG